MREILNSLLFLLHFEYFSWFCFGGKSVNCHYYLSASRDQRCAEDEGDRGREGKEKNRKEGRGKEGMAVGKAKEKYVM